MLGWSQVRKIGQGSSLARLHSLLIRNAPDSVADPRVREDVYRKPSRLRDSRVAGPRLDEGKVSYLEGSLVPVPHHVVNRMVGNSNTG